MINKIKILLLFFLIYNIALCQDVKQTSAFALKQFENKDYESAILTYQRVLYFSNKNEIDCSYYYTQLANCYFELKNYEKAASYYELAYFTLNNDSLKKEAIFKKISCLLLNNQYNFALIELLEIDDNQNEYFNNKKYFYQGITYFGLNQFDSSEIYFIKSIDNKYIKEKDIIKNIFIQNKRINKINPNTARILSMIIPGSGQFYCGDIKNGFNSLILNSSLLALYIYTAYNYSFIDGFISIFPWFQRYYTGGINKAEIIAKRKIEEKRSDIYQQIISTIASTKKSSN